VALNPEALYYPEAYAKVKPIKSALAGVATGKVLKGVLKTLGARPDIDEIALRVALNHSAGFGPYLGTYKAVVEPILNRYGVKAHFRLKYYRFVMEFVNNFVGGKKKLGFTYETVGDLIEKYVRVWRAKREILVDIVRALAYSV